MSVVKRHETVTGISGVDAAGGEIGGIESSGRVPFPDSAIAGVAAALVLSLIVYVEVISVEEKSAELAA